jgi:type VI secretion system lysozyme-like protein
MARNDREALPDRLRPSLFDRLTGRHDGRDGYTLDELYASIYEDLVDLLNTHAPQQDFPEECEFLNRSVAAYGMPDLPSLMLQSEREGVGIGVLLSNILQKFEPRLRDVRVRAVIDPASEKQFLMRFHIDARLSVEPFPQVAFETTLELTTGRTLVEPRS